MNLRDLSVKYRLRAAVASNVNSVTARDWREAADELDAAHAEMLAELEAMADRCGSGLHECLDQAIRDLTVERDRLRDWLRAISNVGHDNDCIFCGWKDRAVKLALAGEQLPFTAPAPSTSTPTPARITICLRIS